MIFKPRQVIIDKTFEEELKQSKHFTEFKLTVATKTDLESKANITDLESYQIKGDYATKEEVAKKADSTELEKYQPKGEYVTSEALEDKVVNIDLSKYQPKGDYATKTELEDKADKVTLSNYQPKGDYATIEAMSEKADKVDLANYQEKGDYATKTEVSIKANTSDLASYQIKGDYATKTELEGKANTEVLAQYQKKGDYATKSEIESSIKLKAEKVHNHEVTDINGLDEKLSELKLEDTAIDVVSESKKLDIVLKELREKDTILTDNYATKEELENAKLEGKDIDLSGYAKTVHTHDISAINSLDVEFQKYQLKETFEKNVIDLINSEYKKLKIINGRAYVGISYSDFLTILKYCKALNSEKPMEEFLFYSKLENKLIFEDFLLNNPSFLFSDSGEEIMEFNQVTVTEAPYTLIYVDLNKLVDEGTTVESAFLFMMIADENMNSRDLLIDTKIDSIIRFLDEEFRDMGESINTITNELSSLI